jgi:hypothetical protein
MTHCPQCGRPVMLPDSVLVAGAWMHRACAAQLSMPTMPPALAPSAGAASGPARGRGGSLLTQGCFVVMVLVLATIAGCAACVRCGDGTGRQGTSRGTVTPRLR